MNTIDILGDEETLKQITARTISAFVDDSLSSIRSYAFAYAGNLSTVELTAIKTIPSQCFYECRNLSNVSFPECSAVYSSAFGYCTNLGMISLPKCTAIYGSAFYRCSNLSEIYIGMSTCYLANSSVFSGTGITKTTGAIYFPASRVDYFKASTNWNYFSARIFGYDFENNTPV